MNGQRRTARWFSSMLDLTLFFVGTLGGLAFAVVALILTLVWIGHALLSIAAVAGPVLVLLALGIDLHMARRGPAPGPRPYPFLSLSAGAVWPSLAAYLMLIER